MSSSKRATGTAKKSAPPAAKKSAPPAARKRPSRAAKKSAPAGTELTREMVCKACGTVQDTPIAELDVAATRGERASCADPKCGGALLQYPVENLNDVARGTLAPVDGEKVRITGQSEAEA